MTDEGVEGIRVTLRLLVSSEAEQRFDQNGNELLQMRGHVIDSSRAHPEVVVRFAGQRQAELRRWAKPGKHLGVDGVLEIKTWTSSTGKHHIALLVEAVSIFPLGDVEVEPSRAGIYAVRGRAGAPVKNKRTSKAERVEDMRRLLDKD